MNYDPSAYPPFAVTVDVVVFLIRNRKLHVVVVQRGEKPFLGDWALPGGFVREDEDLLQAAFRELEEETGLEADDGWYIEQLGTYGDTARDPRMRVVTVAYVVVCADLPRLHVGGDAMSVHAKPISSNELCSLAFDHNQILEDALERVRSKLEYTTLGVKFLGSAFTVAQLRSVYETVWNARLDKGNFQRNFRKNFCFKAIEGAYSANLFQHSCSQRGRPASLWTLENESVHKKSVSVLELPLARRSNRFAT